MARNLIVASLGLALILAYASGQEDKTGDQFRAKLGPALAKENLEDGLRSIIISVKDRKSKATDLKNQLLSSYDTTEVPLSHEERGQRIQLLKNALQDAHSGSQGGILSFLKRSKVNGHEQIDITPLWVTNKIIVSQADGGLITALTRLQDIQSIELDQILSFDDPGMSNVQGSADAVQWGVQAVDAPAQWARNNSGAGVKVGIIDTGCRLSHEALKSNYIDDGYGWLDPSTSKTSQPTDEQGHGTHCAGSILGTTQGIGVAPQAKWMACRGCTIEGCSQSNLMQCGQFMTCPTTATGENEDCSKAPHIVSCSWGGPNIIGNQNFYDDIIKAWQSAGIIPVFALGNSGEQGCKSTGYPGDSKDVIGIGASTNASSIAYFSSLGPTRVLIFFDGRIKPDFSAPGLNIYSAGIQNDTQYVTMSGTSMATPHAAGVIALMISNSLANGGKGLSYSQIRNALVLGSEKTQPHGRLVKNCGRIPETSYPNNHAGNGIVNATKAINNIQPN